MRTLPFLAALTLAAPPALASDEVPPPPTQAAPGPTAPEDTTAFTAAMTSPSDEVRQRCGEPVMGMEQVLTPGGVLLLGELPGTQEIPAFAGKLACYVASAGVPVMVGLELPHEEQAPLYRYLNSDGGSQARLDLTESAIWRRPQQDGRTSEAIVALLDQIRTWRAQKLPISAFAFNAPGQGSERAQAMTRHVLHVREVAPDSSFFLLGGNVYMRTERGTEWDPDFTPLGWHLLQAGLPVRSLDARYAKGTAWTCALNTKDGSLSCDSHPAFPPPPLPKKRVIYRGPRPFVQLAESRTHEGFDGTYYVGPITASPPAVKSTVARGKR
jgi:hypothetical protein